jgi:uncharacterized protein
VIEAPHLPRQALIDAHGGGGFRLPDGIWAWPVQGAAALSEDMLSRVFAHAAGLDFFILGTGLQPWIMPETLRLRFRDAHISADVMATGPAVRTYNVMLMEGRRVGASLIAID